MAFEPIEFTLRSGRVIRCRCYIVSNSIRGPLMFTWSDRAIRNFIRVSENEGRKLFGDYPVIVVPPKLNRDNPDYPELPPCRMIGEFTSDPIDESKHWSISLIVWYQDVQYPAIAESIQEDFASIDWDSVAVDESLEY